MPDGWCRENAYIGRCVKRKIEHSVNAFWHIFRKRLVAGGREKCQYDVAVTLVFEEFDYRTGYSEFTKRCGMNPHRRAFGVKPFCHDVHFA